MPISKITGESILDGSIVIADLGITTFDTGTGNNLTLQANSATGLVIDVTGNTAIANSLSVSGSTTLTNAPTVSSLTVSQAVFTNANKTLVSNAITGTGSVVMSNSPSLVTPSLGAASATSMTVAAGLVGTPSITTTGDTNTGLFFPAADTIAFAEGGVESMRLDSSGRLGIGTNSPSQKLHVAAGTILASNTSTNSATVAIAGNGSTVGTSAFELIQGNSSEAYVFNRANSFLVLGTNNTEQMRITAAGNVGIGTNSPSTRLHLFGNAVTLNLQSTDNLSIINFTNPGGTSKTTSLLADSGGNFYQRAETFRFESQSGASEWMRITSTGNVGIRLTDPAVPLNISIGIQAGSNEKFRIGRSDGLTGSLSLSAYPTTGQSYALIGSNTIFSSGGFARIDTSIGGSGISLNKDNIYFVVSSSSSTNPTERMRIDSSGNVGIGITNPYTRMIVAMPATTSATTVNETADFTAQFVLANDSTTSSANGDRIPLVFNIGNLGGNSISAAIVGEREAAGWNTALSFWTNNITSGPEGTDAIQEKMRITGAGNVGIGTSSPAARLDVVGAGGGNVQMVVSDGANQGRLQLSKSAAYYGFNAGADYGGIQFFSNGTEHMRIGTTGGVSIGTTVQVARLTVQNLGTTNSVTIDVRGNRNFVAETFGATSIIGVSDQTRNSHDFGAIRFEQNPATGDGGGALVRLFAGGASSSFAANAEFLRGDARGITNGVDNIQFRTAGTERMRINVAGNVGIGTASPTFKLQVSGDASITTAAFAGATTPTTANNERITISNSYDGTIAGKFYSAPATNQKKMNFGWNLTTYGSGGSGFMIGGTRGIFSDGAGSTYVSSDGTTVFGVLSADGFTNASPTFTERMRIDSSGNVGIGTSDIGSFGRKLIVNGTGGFNNDAGIVGVGFSRGAANTYGYIGTGDFAVNGLANVDFGISSGSTGVLAFGTGAGTERMRISSGGAVSIGTTSDSSARLTVRSNSGGTDVVDSVAQFTLGDSGTYQGGILTVKNAGNRGSRGNGDGSVLIRASFNNADAFIIDKFGNMQMDSGYGSAATAYGCRAWVNFNGTGTVAIRGSGNVSSITDNGTGDYTLNFTTAMPDGNYVLSGTAMHPTFINDHFVSLGDSNGAAGTLPSTTSVRFRTMYNNSANTPQDCTYVTVMIVR